MKTSYIEVPEKDRKQDAPKKRGSENLGGN
ncbi:MAG: hypothetical protein K0S75_1450 [Clostridia bacterium]|jgi:hypothetical protein|nr:hypothetical protein [Clostridia bacterium]